MILFTELFLVLDLFGVEKCSSDTEPVADDIWERFKVFRIKTKTKPYMHFS